MKVLQLCPKPPYPQVDGSSFGMNVITQGLLKAGCQVKVLAVSTLKHKALYARIDEDYIKKTNVEFVDIDISVKIIPAFLNLFTNQSYNITRFISKKFEKKLIEILTHNKFDVIQIESLFLTPYLETIRKYSDALVILKAHNIEYLILDRRYMLEQNFLKKAYLKILSKRLFNYETNIISKFDGLIAVSTVDEKFFKYHSKNLPSISVPTGVTLDFEYKQSPFENCIFYFGALDWQPNYDGLLWFIDEVWDDLKKEIPELKLIIAGRKSKEILKINKEGIDIIGEVPSSEEFMERHQIMISPVFYGSGIRNKIIEAFAHGKTVISTTLGAEGLEYENNSNILIANEKNEFIANIKKCIENKEFTYKIGGAARLTAEKYYDNDKLTGEIINFYKSLLK